MEFKDYYKILGVEPDADRKAIKSAYRKLARKYHPDVSTERDAEKNFKEVSEAYEVLNSEEKRAEYDQLRQYGGGERFTPPPGWTGAGGGARGDGRGFGAGSDRDFSDFFESVFGGGFRQQGGAGGGFGGEDFFSTASSGKGQDVEIEMPVFLEDTLSTESKTVEYKLPHYGEGGRLPDIKKTLKVKIPAGVSDGERIRLKGQGGPGFGKGPAGDLYLRIRLVPHPLFDVVGRDLNITVPVTPWEAALGARITVPTLTGRITLTIAPDSQSGQRLRIKGKGLIYKTSRQAGKTHGDLYAILKVVMPAKSNETMRSLWRQMASESAFDPRSDWAE